MRVIGATVGHEEGACMKLGCRYPITRGLKIPLLIGGASRAAIRRAARVGNGWHPTAMPPEALRAAMEAVAVEAQAAGRSAADIPVSISVPMQGGRPGRYGLGTEPAEMVKPALSSAS